MQRVRANCIGTLKTFCACEYPLPWDIGSCFPVVHRGDCAADECGVRAYTQRLDIALAPDCTEKQGTSEPARDGLVSPCLGLMCVVAQLTSPQVTSAHKTRASQWLCPKQNWTPAFPGGLESDPPLRWYSASSGGPPIDSVRLPLLRVDGSIVPPNKALEFSGCSMETSASLTGPSTCQCRRAAYSILLFRPFLHLAGCGT